MDIFPRDVICQYGVELVNAYLMYLALADPNVATTSEAWQRPERG